MNAHCLFDMETKRPQITLGSSIKEVRQILQIWKFLGEDPRLIERTLGSMSGVSTVAEWLQLKSIPEDVKRFVRGLITA